MGETKTNLDMREAEQQELDARDQAFRDEWQKQQEEAYPSVYRDAAKVRVVIAENAARDEANRQRILGLEPGHDPTRQAANLADKELLDNIAATAGDDNRPPHETTPQSAQPNPPAVNPQASAEETEEEEETGEDGKPKGGRKKADEK